MSCLFKVKHGFAFDGKFFRPEGDYILLTPGNFYDEGGFKLKDKEKFFVGDIPEEYVLKKGDLIVAMTEQAEGLLGSSAIIPVSNRFLHNQRLGLISEWEPSQVDSGFLYYLFNTRSVRSQIRSSASGAKVRHTSPSRIGEVTVFIPCVTIQRKIASILFAYDDLIENNTRRIAILETMAQAIYREWFVEFRFPGHKTVKLVDSPVGKIPAGWTIAPVQNFLNHSTSGLSPSEYPEEEFAHYSIPNYDTGRLPQLEKGETILSNKFPVPDGCVLLSKLNPRIPRIWLPILNPQYRAIASTEFLVMAPIPPITREFAYSLCHSDEFYGRFCSLSSGTSTSHQRVKPTDFVKMEAVIPPNSLLEQFSVHVTPILRLGHNRRLQNANLRKTRDLLLPKLLAGELDVKDLDIEIGDQLVEAIA
jgi:type I restriction enzyme S subunit